MGHPPEPWEAIRLGNVDYRSEHDVSIEHIADGTVIQSIDKWTAERIVACVNFCRNLPTEWLQKHAATHPWKSPVSLQWNVEVQENAE